MSLAEQHPTLDRAISRSRLDLQREAAADVDRLVNALEPTLDRDQRRLLHQLRLAAETLGAIQATVGDLRHWTC